MKNPFHQPAKLHQLSFELPREAVPALETLFEEETLSASSFEIEGNEAMWRVQLLMETPPPENEIRARLARIGEALRVEIAPPLLETIEPYDWVSAVQRDFPPLELGRYFVHGSHLPPKRGLIGLRIDAGAAFGSGEHATTSGCLRALDRLARRRVVHRPLDMGCGSAILALAIAKRWKGRAVLAIDIDEVSVRVARGNIRDNGMQTWVRAEAGNGYRARGVAAGAPYDLIVANILARPLVEMSRDLSRHMAPGGIAILSGLLARQEKMVLAAHRAAGLVFRERIAQAGWHTLVLEKPGRSLLPPSSFP